MITGLCSRKSRILVLQRLFSRTNLKGKPLTFEWQNQTGGPAKTAPRWQTAEEIREQRSQEVQRLEDEDFRLDMFDLHPKPRPPVVEEDELFGTSRPPIKPFDTAHFKEIYHTAAYAGKNLLSDQKLAYLPNFCAPFEIAESFLADHLGLIRAKVEEFLAPAGGFVEQITDSEWEAFYTSSEVLPLLERLALLVQRTNQVSLPNLVLCLSRELHYNRDYSSKAPVFREIERLLNQLLHILPLRDLVKLYFGLTFVFPKKCSTELRMRIRDRIAEASFGPLSVEELLETFTAFKNDLNGAKIHQKCFKGLVGCHAAVKRLCDSGQPATALNVIYTFANARLAKRFRKKIEVVNGRETADQIERDELERLYMPLVIAQAHTYDAIEFIRLLSAFKILGLKNYDEVFGQIESFVLAKGEGLPLQQFAFLLHYMAKTNVRGFGGRAFWAEAARRISSWLRPDDQTALNDVARILEALASNKALDFATFERTFGGYLTRALGGDRHCSYHELAMLATAFTYLDLSVKQKDLMRPFIKQLVVRLSRQTEWVPLLYYNSIKLFSYYVSKRHPTWNLEHVYNLCYHAEKYFNTERVRPRTLSPEYSVVATIVQKDLELALLSFVDFENLFLIDFAIEDYRFAVVLQKELDCLYSAEGEERVPHPLFDLKREILALHGWTVCTIDLAQFNRLGQTRATWLKNQIQEHFKRAVDKAGAVAEEKVARVTQRLERIATMDITLDPTYPQHVLKAQVIDSITQKEKTKKLAK